MNYFMCIFHLLWQNILRLNPLKLQEQVENTYKIQEYA